MLFILHFCCHKAAHVWPFKSKSGGLLKPCKITLQNYKTKQNCFDAISVVVVTLKV